MLFTVTIIYILDYKKSKREELEKIEKAKPENFCTILNSKVFCPGYNDKCGECVSEFKMKKFKKLIINKYNEIRELIDYL